MKTLSPTQQACLDAMGIDVWVSRDQIEEAAIEKAVIEEAVVDVNSVSDANLIVEPEIQNIDAKDQFEQLHAAISAKPAVAQEEKISTIITEQPDAPTNPIFDIPTDWNGLAQAVSSCQRCELHNSRTHTVFGSGNQNADWLIIGDTPTVDDDKNGNPFTGQSGELLTAMLRAIKLTRQQVYITNTLKCTTPNNREPEESELDTCLQYLHKQISLINPKLILVLGQSAAQRVLNNQSTLARLRQKVHTLEESNISVPVIVSYHPSSLLSMPANKGKAWQDLLFAQKTISSQAVL